MSIIIRLQNLPWAADSMDIRRYFAGLSIPEGGVHIVGGEMGDAFIAFSTDEDARLAMAKDGGKIHEMQIKLLLSSRTEMMRVIEKARQLNLAMQAQAVPLAPPVVPPVVPQAAPPPPRVAAPPVVEEERRRRSPSPSHRRVSRDKSPGRGDRRRGSPDSRRSSSRRDRSRSPSRSSRGSNRDTDRRDRSKRDDRRHDDSRGRDDRHSARDNSHDSKKYPETDSFGRQPRSSNDGYRESNNHRYNNNEAPSPHVSSYTYESTQNTDSMKGLPAAFLPQTNQMHSSDPFAVGKQTDSVGVSSSSSSVYMQQPASYGTVPYGQPSQATKDGSFPPKSDNMSRRSRFEPDYSQSQDSPYYNSPNINSKVSIPEVPFKDARSAPQDFHPQNRNPWSSPADIPSSNWPPKQSGLLEPPSAKNGDYRDIPMEIEQTPPHVIPPTANQYLHSEPYMAPRNMPIRANDMQQEKQWPSTPSMSIVVSGLPPDARIEEVIDIFRSATIPSTNICIVTSSQGAKEAFVRFSTTADFHEAVNGQPRFIRNYRCDITKISDALFEAAIGNPMATKLRPKPRPNESDLCVQLKGLPYSSKEPEIERFFEDLKIVDIAVELSSEGRSVGIAFVQFATEKDFRMALTMNGKMIGHRFITISVASKDHIMIARGLDSTQKVPPKAPLIPDFDIRHNQHAPAPLLEQNPVPDITPQPATNFCITLKGMPTSVTNQDIVEFFREVSGAIRAIHLMLGPDKRPSGDAYVEFGTKGEATAALNKNSMMLLGSRVFVSPISYGEMTNILNGPKAIPPPPAPGPLLKTPLMASPEKSRRPLLDVPPSQNDFREPLHNNMKNEPSRFDQPANEMLVPSSNERPSRFEDPREKFPPHDRSRPDYSRGDRPPSDYPPRERSHSDYPPRERDHPPRERPRSDHSLRDRPPSDHPLRDRPPSDYPPRDRPRSEFPRGDRPSSDYRHGDRPSSEFRAGDGPPRDHPRNERPPRGDRSYPPNDRPHSDYPPRGERGSFPPNERPPSDFPEGERDYPPDDYPHGDDLPPPPEFHGGDRPPPDYPRGERPPPGFQRGGPPRFPRGDRPPMHSDFPRRGEHPRFEPRFRGSRPPLMERGMRPPFGRMRGPFPGGRPPHDPSSPAGFGAPGCVVSLNNLHYDAGLEELYDFFKDYPLTKDNIIRRFDESGRATAEARVSFPCPADAQRVVRELNKKPIMGRSVFLSLL